MAVSVFTFLTTRLVCLSTAGSGTSGPCCYCCSQMVFTQPSLWDWESGLWFWPWAIWTSLTACDGQRMWRNADVQSALMEYLLVFHCINGFFNHWMPTYVLNWILSHFIKRSLVGNLVSLRAMCLQGWNRNFSHVSPRKLDCHASTGLGLMSVTGAQRQSKRSHKWLRPFSASFVTDVLYRSYIPSLVLASTLTLLYAHKKLIRYYYYYFFF